MYCSGEPDITSSTTVLDIDGTDGSSDSISFDSTTKLKSSPTSRRRGLGEGGFSGDVGCDGADAGDATSGIAQKPRRPRSPWSKEHQRMLVAVFLVGFLFAVVVGAAYFLDSEPGDWVHFRAMLEAAAASSANGTSRIVLQ
ncbi:hypothetical protein HPB50_016472 [Hyalomma asiaticum]|uniref:Uncharacterized protein n=1 Tax=Hyalomma asiaticum TaxID=266040 RepID=A0ACB7S0I8_HYAAI|nr:hypothetical protein HPB50_016472 [Hyalomma asiaticum]